MNIKNRRYVFSFLALIFISLFCSGVYYLISVYLRIEHIVVRSTTIKLVVDEDKIPKNLLFFPTQSIESQLLKEYPQLADIKFHKKFPRTLEIEPILRHPIAIVIAKSESLLIDPEGYVVGYGDQGLQLPRILIPIDVLPIGKRITDAGVQLSLGLIRHISDWDTVYQIEKNDTSSLKVKTQKTSIIIAQEADLEGTMSTLQTLIEGFRIKGRLPTVVDLRFDKPVVRF